VALLLLAFLILILIENGRTINLPLPRLNLPDLPNISIPITGLPKLEIPTTRIEIPEIIIQGTPIPGGAAVFAAPSKSIDCRLQGSLPDPGCTPGAVIDDSAGQVCTPGYGILPQAVPAAQKEAVFAAYGISSPAAGQYRIDTLIPPTLGGSNETANLWPQSASPLPGYAEKEALARYLRDRVCGGAITLEAAQRSIANNWVAAYEDMAK
jgi:hypothetical protein